MRRYGKKTQRRRSYKGKKFAKGCNTVSLSGTLGSVMSRVQKQVHTTVLGATVNIPIVNNIGQPGFQLAGETGQGVGMWFDPAGFYISTGGVGDTNGTSGQYSNTAAFLSVYDQLKIRKVIVEICFDTNSVVQPGPTGDGLPILYTCIDYDDVNAPVDADSVLAYSSSRTIQLGNTRTNGGKQTLYLNKPTTQITSLETGAGAGFNPLWVSPWMSTDRHSAAHFGFKMWIDFPTGLLTTTSVQSTITFTVRQFVDFRNTK